MSRIDLARLRKSAGMSQRELAEKLRVRQSFLSAIENGKSRIPDEKLSQLKEIFGITDFSRFLVSESDEPASFPAHTHLPDETNDSITRLLEHIHAMAHRNDSNGAESRVAELEERVSFLSQRNDRLSDRLDQLREQVDTLRDENSRLREILARHSIPF